MGRMKELMIERMEQEDDRSLAKKLGITYEELIQLNHTIDTEESKDGLVYNYIVSFDDDAPRHILDKVKGLDGNNTVWLAPWELGEDDYYEEQYEAIISNKDYYQTFLRAIDAAKKLNNVHIEGDGLNDILKRQVYVSIMA